MPQVALINEQIRRSWESNKLVPSPPATDGVTFQEYADRRICAWGSNHAGGANFIFVDGSGRFLTDETPLKILRRLATRDAAETVDAR